MENSKFRFSALMLCLGMIIIFIIQNLADGFTDTFILTSTAFSEPWRLVTSIFLHGSVTHLLSNMFALGVFGLLFEKLVGTRRFLILFLITGIIANLAAVMVYSASLGASGAIFGIMGAFAALRPKEVVWTYGVPMPLIVAASFWLLLDVAGVFYPSDVANIAHIIGLISGLIIGLALRRFYQQTRPDRRRQGTSNEELDQWERDWM